MERKTAVWACHCRKCSGRKSLEIRAIRGKRCDPSKYLKMFAAKSRTFDVDERACGSKFMQRAVVVWQKKQRLQAFCTRNVARWGKYPGIFGRQYTLSDVWELMRGWQQSRPTADRPSTDTRRAPVNFDAERKPRETHRWFRRIFGASQAEARCENLQKSEGDRDQRRRSSFYIWHICCQVLAPMAKG